MSVSPAAASTPFRLAFERSLEGRRVLVTGHSGFTGGWLCLWLQEIGAEVAGLSLPPNTEPNLYDAAAIARGLRSQFGDIRDGAVVRGALEGFRPEVVFHLAAQPLVSAGFDDPIATFATNVLGTAHVLEAARQVAGVKAVVCVTTDKVYADPPPATGHSEGDALGGKDPYSASKACAELVGAAYRATLAARANGVSIAMARGGNIIGGGDWAQDRIVPDFVRAAASGGALTLRNPAAVRPWQHVLALVHGYLQLADRLLAGDAPPAAAYNFGPSAGDAKPVAALVDALGRNWREAAVRVLPGGFPETAILTLDSARARSELGWRPPLDFETTVRLTAEWYRAFEADPGQARAVTLAQIGAYRRAATAAA